MVLEEELLRGRIKELKIKKKAIILAHNYQIPEIQDIADFLGDSLELAKISKSIDCKIVVFCGVRFMAETVKILSPNKKVLLPVENAGCPLANTIAEQDLLELKSKYKDAKVISYVNTSVGVKAESDICCTSANAVNLVRNIDSQRIIFVPDKNLGRWVQKNNPSKELIIWPGFCYVHQKFTLEDLQKMKALYPQAEVLVHPECRAEVQDNADFVLSTSGILKRAKESKAKRFIIGTEEGIIYRLKKENPQKEFYSLGEKRICLDMKKTTLDKLYQSLEEERYPIFLKESVIKRAEKALEEMVEWA